MKNLLILIYMIIAVNTAVAGNNTATRMSTTDAEMIVVPAPETSTVKLVYKSKAVNDVVVTIYDENGHKLFTDKLSAQQGFIRPYNFANAKGSKFTIEVKDGSGVASKEVDLSKEAVPALQADLLNLSDANKVELKVRNVAKAVSVVIVNRFNQVVFEETLEVGKNFSRVYNFGTMKASGCVMSITDGQTTIQKKL